MKLAHSFLQLGLSAVVIYCSSCNSSSTSTKENTSNNSNKIVDSVETVTIPSGDYQMGNDNGTNYEKPVHTVHLSSFGISKFEITYGQFRNFIKGSGYKTSSEKQGFSNLWNGNEWTQVKGVTWENDSKGNKYNDTDINLPVVHVSWDDAVEYCNWLSKKTGKTYRLPTEAEWEYAANGGLNGTKTTYSGSNVIEEVGWYNKNSNNSAHKGGMKGKNALGICDMTGNVWEWCSDFYNENYYSNSPKDNPKGPEKGQKKVLRGGSFSSEENLCINTLRYCFSQEETYGNLGFRVVQEIK